MLSCSYAVCVNINNYLLPSKAMISLIGIASFYLVFPVRVQTRLNVCCVGLNWLCFNLSIE